MCKRNANHVLTTVVTDRKWEWAMDDDNSFDRTRALKRLAIAVLVGIPVGISSGYASYRLETSWGANPSRSQQAGMLALVVVAGAAFVPLLVTIMEVVAGVPFLQIASRWNALKGWQRGMLGLLAVLAMMLVMGIVAGVLSSI